jgi:hypothetical protein
MTIGELSSMLDRLRDLYSAAGADGPAKDLKTLSEVLQPHAHREVGAFVRDVNVRLSQAGGMKRPKKGSVPSKTVSLNCERIEHHVSHLRNAGVDQADFSAAFENVKADKSLRLADMAEIARLYSDSDVKVTYRSAAAAQKDISAAFVRRARFLNKIR